MAKYKFSCYSQISAFPSKLEYIGKKRIEGPGEFPKVVLAQNSY
jgi:hypothetical protein